MALRRLLQNGGGSLGRALGAVGGRAQAAFGFAAESGLPAAAPSQAVSGAGSTLGLWSSGSFASSVFRRTKVTNSGMKYYKPTTPGFRGRVITERKELWKGKPFKPLTTGKKSISGRNHHGKVTVRFRGGGHKRLYRFIDFQRRALPDGVFGEVERIEYDPNRSARIALVKYPGTEADPEAEGKGVYKYILASQEMTAGLKVTSGPGAPVKPGNTLMLQDIPAGTTIHNIELRPGKGAQMVRSAGTSAVLLKKGEDGYALVKLPSGEQRSVRSVCTATIGVVSNAPHKNRKLGKAGASRWMGRKPHNRGISMNPVDHPLGGGRGKSKSRKHPVSPTGVPAKGFKTRKNPRTEQYIQTSRHAAKKRR
mmetsp:Transcript_24466/g.43540  ORF Transcript_24466/g.43540 Transcript_24466/m.43540 type:complete len:366 (-) Transcript_24466:170-1267(-)|eukprot:CAMPEP_0177771400 /NCGR_PEP_ID=MMETSP0491_2-20121128/11560_1 /TAXON_ID=63592 /ORGANISM="Tetraselmis chuii, Strain PLY429" /LENGTH=365 /DNA_ID=CAMNT_0019288923 /DNA_START=26 /DNA_END=1123 /DNA_ORIENTATION=-